MENYGVNGQERMGFQSRGRAFWMILTVNVEWMPVRPRTCENGCVAKFDSPQSNLSIKYLRRTNKLCYSYYVEGEVSTYIVKIKHLISVRVLLNIKRLQ